MLKEIGGYFGLEHFEKEEYYSDLLAVNNARNALVYLLHAKKISKIFIPFFLCDSVSKVCEREGYAYDYYNVGPDFLPIFEKQLDNNEYIYIVNYYGQINNNMLKGLTKKYKRIIFDNVQAFYQKPIDGVDTIYSCRKFFGVPDGGYLSTNVDINREIVVDNSKERMGHILGRCEGTAREFYNEFKKNDEMFVNLELRWMSELTHNILRAVDYESVKLRRELNYKILEKELGYVNKLDFFMPDGPYCYPFYCEKGMELKQKLATKNVYVATLWPNVIEMEGTLEKDLAQNILPLPCDQRYGMEEMLYISQEIKELLKI